MNNTIRIKTQSLEILYVVNITIIANTKVQIGSIILRLGYFSSVQYMIIATMTTPIL